MKKALFLPLIIIIIILGIIGNTFLNPSPELNEEYINSEVLTGMDYIEEILLIDKQENYIACVCSISDQEIMLLFFKNNKSIDLHYKHSVAIELLSEDPLKEMNDGVLLSKENIKYNIFLNPSSDVIEINGVGLKVHRVCQKDARIGFWWDEI
ncbi:MAG: hypothetical protein J6I80_05265 [Clostridia bacterium]|nr:hypothetical protein [Clostridia bacterium]